MCLSLMGWAQDGNVGFLNWVCLSAMMLIYVDKVFSQTEASSLAKAARKRWGIFGL